MKIALISTPRSGNTWLRALLARLYGLQQYAVHTPQELVWHALPPACIVQLHWHCTADFTALLQREGMRALTIARHPLAVLLSIWHFARYEPQTANWLAGEGGNESTILERPVASQAFLDYACSPRAAALLAVTPEWFIRPEVTGVCYEDLIFSPVQALKKLCEKLGEPVCSIDVALQETSLEKLRLTAANEHFWQGLPFAWRDAIPSNHAYKIWPVHRTVFDALGYSEP